ncbi:TetR/AcrR family transcriptional regulator [Mycolicibacterium aichiense]|uniref:TetR/AcrR family transcriptional regulator n=1 Tax=Mycolicibacterium aichiense TaxID=1799 RepID=UPI000E04BB20|nr:TetR/AcrR family transcriptional regulator [Mycolicibacterium aichiense]MCV7016811.1 TetR/AcrR family transcriptional regulator [Mycolicibacterium aichiense]SUA13969.1 TetR family transcriptional regulator [Mycolicibacterium aichiense]
MTSPPGTNERPSERRRSRRDEYAEQTRQAVLASARTLFAERGYFATTINDIAAASRVSAGTVYQQCGGKQGLLRSLMDSWTTSDLVQGTLDQIERCESPAEVYAALADSYLEFWRRYDDIVQLVLATAVHDEAATESLGQAMARHRAALYEIARKLRTLGDFADSFTDEDFADITLYHYGPHNGFHFTVTVLGWPEDRAKEFLSTQFRQSLHAAATN